jgi:hypothetical protein
MTEIPKDAFQEILLELQRQPITMNQYRTRAGAGCSQTFGIVNRRSLAPDYSRQNWLRPYLYHLLLEFASKHVTIPFNSITVNYNYKAAKHRDKNNKGESYLVAFGDYVGGDLKILEGDLSGTHNICYRPVVTDFSKVYHEVSDFVGDRYSLVFYTFESPRSLPLPAWSLQLEGTKWFFYRNGLKITKETGLPHPLRGRKKTQRMLIVTTPAIVEFD